MKKLFIIFLIIIATIFANIVCSTYHHTPLLSFENIEALANNETFDKRGECVEAGMICFNYDFIYPGLTIKK